ncbi:MAG: helix-turn-helix domain-containing protein [Myxococcaceae bacterium]
MFLHLVLDGVFDGALGVGLDVVSTAAQLIDAKVAGHARHRRLFEQRVVSLDGRPVRSGNGRLVPVDGAWRGARRGEVVVIPGLSAATPGAVERLLSRGDVTRGVAAVAKVAKVGATVAASCSATFVLGQAGLLDGRPATTTWWLTAPFRQRFPRAQLEVERMVVDGRGVMTAGSAFSHADLMLALVARRGGPSLAHAVARYLVLDERASQARYMVAEHLRTSDPALRAVERFVARNVGRQVRLEELARVASVSSRSLARRMAAAFGMTPLEYVQRVRVAEAAHLLESTKVSVEEVAARVGYADAAAFRRVFRRVAGVSPRGRT